MERYTYKKDLRVKHNVDVFVAGGGPAGVAAAVAAARRGASVYIAESFTAFGGAAVTMLVPAFMQFGDGENFLAAGIGTEVFESIKEKSYPSFQKYCPHSIPVETLKIIYDDMVVKSGALFSFNTNVIDVCAEGGRISAVICASKGSVFAVKAKVYVDCTGDGDVAFYAGAEYALGNEQGELMASTLCGIWAGISWGDVKGNDGRMLDKAFEDGLFTNEDRHLPGMWRIADGIGGSNAGHIYDINGCDADSLTKGIINGRKQLAEYREYYRNYLTGFERAELVYSASQIGIRETRRIIGDYTLCLDDFISRAIFDDEIGRYCYNIDIHSAVNTKEGFELFSREHKGYRYSKGESYGIPYRTLTPKDFSNLIVAGRCVSADRHMQSSLRVMPGCFITGQAAGTAAAICAADNSDVHDADITEIQRALLSLGAFLPNFKA